MKDLDRSKVYDLSYLSKKQRKSLYDWLLKNDLNWAEVFKRDFIKINKDFLIYKDVEWDWVSENNNDKKQITTNALELFDEEKKELVFNGKRNIMDIEVDFKKVEAKEDNNNENEPFLIEPIKNYVLVKESSLIYKEYIDLGFEREDINDQVRFNQSGYFGYILIKKIKKGLEIQVTDCSLNEPKLYLKHDFVLSLSKEQVLQICK